MRRITLWIVSTVSALVLLFSYHTSTGGGSAQAQSVALAPTTPGTASTATTPTATASPAPSSATSSSGSTSSKSTGKSGTYTGSSVDTQWGPVQVKITVKNGKVTDVQAVVYPDGNGRDQEINAYALPVLHDEVLQAQSAQIDAVGGATVTSDGYISSLQSALDAANLKS